MGDVWNGGGVCGVGDGRQALRYSGGTTCTRGGRVRCQVSLVESLGSRVGCVGGP